MQRFNWHVLGDRIHAVKDMDGEWVAWSQVSPLLKLRLEITRLQKEVARLEAVNDELLDIACHYSELGKSEIMGLVQVSSDGRTGELSLEEHNAILMEIDPLGQDM